MAKKKKKKQKKLRHFVEAVATGAIAGALGTILAELILRALD